MKQTKHNTNHIAHRLQFKRAALLLVCVLFTGLIIAQDDVDPYGQLQLETLRTEDALFQAPYTNSELVYEVRVADLLKRMTINEKIGQMLLVDWRYLASEDDIRHYLMGGILGGGGAAPQTNTPVEWVKLNTRFQRQAQSTPLRIPLLIGNDGVHGFSNLKDSTVFPHHIGLGATNNPALVEDIAEITAKEMSAVGVNWNYSPAVSVPQDIRWGRTYEGFSADPAIVSRLSVAEIKGYQQIDKLLSTPKHFVADGGTNLGKDRGNSVVTPDELRAIHLPPFRAAVEQNAMVIMASYSSINGIKMHQRDDLIQGILKDELGFKGFVVSDWGAIYELPGSLENQLKLSINAGIDMIMVPELYQELAFALHRVVASGDISMARINDAVSRILLAKFHAGLFEPGGARSNRQYVSSIGSAEHRAVATQAVEESLVLLKNHANVLPLTASSDLRVLVVGTHADDIGAQSGGWTIEWQGRRGAITSGTTILQGIQQYVSQIDYAPTRASIDQFNGNRYDVIIAAIGENPYAEGQGDNPNPQVANYEKMLIDHLATQFEAPVITLIISGRPLILDTVYDQSSAVIAAWLPGTEAGTGIANVLFGATTFTGTLPYQWPLDKASLVHGQGTPQFPLGYGLTY